MNSTAEIQALSDLYRNAINSCYKKCLLSKETEATQGKGWFSSSTDEGELTENEKTCDDNCVVKYLKTHKRVGKVFEEQSAEQGYKQ